MSKKKEGKLREILEKLVLDFDQIDESVYKNVPNADDNLISQAEEDILKLIPKEKSTEKELGYVYYNQAIKQTKRNFDIGER